MLRKSLTANYLMPILFCFGLMLFYLYSYQLRLLPSLLDNGLTQHRFGNFVYGGLYSFYYLGYVALQLVVGLCVDRYPLSRLVVVALLISSLGCYLFGNASALWMSKTGLVMMGLGASFIFVTTLKAMSFRLKNRHFSFFLGSVICMGAVGLLLSDVLLVFVLKHWGWRLVCYSLVLLALGLVIINYAYLRFKQKLYHFANKRPPLRVELDCLKSYLCNRQLLIRCLIGILLYMPTLCFIEAWGARFLSNSYQFPLLTMLLDIGMLLAGFALGSPLLGWLYDKTSESQLILMTGAVGSTVLLSIILCVPALSPAKMGFFLFLLGIFSSSVIIIFALNRQLASYGNVGKVFGVTNFFMMLSGSSAFLMSWLLAIIEKNEWVKLLPFYATSSYQLALLFLPCGTLVAVFLTFYIRDERKPL